MKSVPPVQPGAPLVIDLGAPPNRWRAFMERIEALASEGESAEGETDRSSQPLRDETMPSRRPTPPVPSPSRRRRSKKKEKSHGSKPLPPRTQA